MKPLFYQLSLSSIFLLSLTNVASSVVISNQSNSFQQQLIAKYSYPQETVNDYLQKCIQQATSQGLDQQNSQKMCSCTLKKFQELYTVEQLNELSRQAETNPQSAQKLMNVGYACLDEFLYEN